MRKFLFGVAVLTTFMVCNFASAEKITNKDVIDINFVATDFLTGVQAVHYSWDNVTFTEIIFSKSLPMIDVIIKDIPIPGKDGKKTIYTKFVDGATNITKPEDVIKSTFTKDTNPPINISIELKGIIEINFIMP